jgi:hypothetical protein
MSQEMVQETEQAQRIEDQPYPVNFLSIIAEDGSTLLGKWLETHQAPREVIELANGLACLSVAIEIQLRHPDKENFELSASGLLQVTRGIDYLGGYFCGMNSRS